MVAFVDDDVALVSRSRSGGENVLVRLSTGQILAAIPDYEAFARRTSLVDGWTFPSDSGRVARQIDVQPTTEQGHPGVILCQCAYQALIPPHVFQTLAASLTAARVPFTAVADLCELAARRDPLLQAAAHAPRLVIAACHPRAIKALFFRAGVSVEPGRTQCINLREASLDQALADLQVPRGSKNADDAASFASPALTGWLPWFPVIDYDRCTHCHQCLGFCLFGVYALSADGKVVVDRPESCKPNCPACARICPSVAIIFPKYASGAIAGGPITDEALEQERIQADLETILGSDTYAALAERRKKAQQRRLLREQFHQAQHERQQHLDGAAGGSAADAPDPADSTARSTAIPTGT